MTVTLVTAAEPVGPLIGLVGPVGGQRPGGGQRGAAVVVGDGLDQGQVGRLVVVGDRAGDVAAVGAPRHVAPVRVPPVQVHAAAV